MEKLAEMKVLKALDFIPINFFREETDVVQMLMLVYIGSFQKDASILIVLVW